MSKRVKIIAVSLLLAAMVAISFGAGCALGARTSTEPGLDIVEQAWEVIFQDYVTRTGLMLKH